MACDKVDWHVSGEGFPPGTRSRNAATHMGMFLEWADTRGLLAEDISPLGSWLLRRRWISGRTYVVWFCDSTFSSENQLSPNGHAFAEAYYNSYCTDFEALFAAEYASPYKVRYSRRNIGRVAKMLDERYSACRSSRDNKTD